MTKHANPFRYFNSSPEVIRLVVMMYVKFPLSLRNVEDLLAERGIDVSYETVRYWCRSAGPADRPRPITLRFSVETGHQRPSQERTFVTTALSQNADIAGLSLSGAGARRRDVCLRGPKRP
jgi:hypothetical protein